MIFKRHFELIMHMVLPKSLVIKTAYKIFEPFFLLVTSLGIHNKRIINLLQNKIWKLRQLRFVSQAVCCVTIHSDGKIHSIVSQRALR